MPRIMVSMKLTEDERALLSKGAKANEMTESDYLRVCMVMDRLMAADPLALKLMAGKLRERVQKQLGQVMGLV